MQAEDPRAQQVVDFWLEAGPARWWAKDDAFDRTFSQRFLALHELASGGELSDWLRDPVGALALVILLDQFPRNAFRGSARMFASDALARAVANAALESHFDQQVDPRLRLFFYMPFEHSESLADQERSVTLQRGLDVEKYALEHRDIIQRFGRFPHRNALLGRETTEEEQAFLDAGGFAG